MDRKEAFAAERSQLKTTVLNFLIIILKEARANQWTKVTKKNDAQDRVDEHDGHHVQNLQAWTLTRPGLSIQNCDSSNSASAEFSDT